MSAPGAKVRITRPIRYFGRYWRPGDEVSADSEDGLGLITMFPHRVEVVPDPLQRRVPDYLSEAYPERIV